MSEDVVEKPKRVSILVLLPLILFVSMAALFFFQLTSGRNSTTIPSVLIDKPVPDFALPALEGVARDGVPIPGFDTASTKGADVTIVNVWASWCVPCRDEHPFVKALGADPRIRLYGLNQRDQAASARSFLEELGNPYDAIGVDARGRVSIDFGVYGVPETFVIDKAGLIVHKFIGPINQRRMNSELLPAIEKALQRSAEG